MSIANNSLNLPILLQLRNFIQNLNNVKQPKFYKSEIIQLVNKLGVQGEKFMFTILMELYEKDKSVKSNRNVFLSN